MQFVAFTAHFCAAALIVEHAYHDHLLVALFIMSAAGVKEFWYDAKYEANPPQTFLDNFEDWLGWSLGALLGVLLAH
jgi:hypothetical protein